MGFRKTSLENLAMTRKRRCAARQPKQRVSAGDGRHLTASSGPAEGRPDGSAGKVVERATQDCPEAGAVHSYGDPCLDFAAKEGPDRAVKDTPHDLPGFWSLEEW